LETCLFVDSSCRAAAALFAGTKAKGPLFSEYGNIPPSKALVYIYRPAEGRGYGRAYHLTANGQRITKLLSGGYFPYVVDPNAVTFSAHLKWAPGISLPEHVFAKKEDEVEVKLEAGKIYYVKLHQETKFTHFVPHLLSMPPEEGLKEIRKCRRLEPEK